MDMTGISERLGTYEEEQREMLFSASAQLRVAVPGIIDSFDPERQTASVQPAITENIQIEEGGTTPTRLPLLSDVPVCFPRGGGYCITLPVEKGDECLLVFADMCIDGWWQSGGVQSQMETRRHDLSDAIAIMGVTSQPRKVAGYSPNRMQMRTDDAGVIVEVDKAERSVAVSKCRKLAANASELIYARCEGDVSIEAGGDIDINAGGGIRLVASGDILIQGATVSINP